MHIVEPAFTILYPKSKSEAVESLCRVELAGRVCYKSEDRVRETQKSEDVHRTSSLIFFGTGLAQAGEQIFFAARLFIQPRRDERIVFGIPLRVPFLRQPAHHIARITALAIQCLVDRARVRGYIEDRRNVFIRHRHHAFDAPTFDHTLRQNAIV